MNLTPLPLRERTQSSRRTATAALKPWHHRLGRLLGSTLVNRSALVNRVRVKAAMPMLVGLAAFAGMGCGVVQHNTLPADKTISRIGQDAAKASSAPEEHETFLGYCKSSTISPDQKHTVAMLRSRLEDPTVDCDTAYEQLSNLPFLYLENIGIRDLSPIRGFKRLSELFLVSNPITTTANLKNLPALRNIDLDNVGLTEVPELNQMKTLRFLKLDNNRIKDISGLPKWITNLWINNIPVQDLGPLEGMDLTRLDASMLPAGLDWTPVSTLTKLTSLRINDNALTNLDFVSTLTKLTLFEANSNQIVDISPLEPLNKLRHVELNNNQIINGSMLLNKLTMTDLRMAFNDIRKINMTEKNDQVTDLTLDGNPIVDCAFVRFLPGLQKLYIENMKLTTINGLDDNLPFLDTLSIKGNKIDTLTPLSKNKSDFKRLVYLDISDNEVKNYGPLMRIKSEILHTFYGYGNPIEPPYCPMDGVAPAIAHFCETLKKAKED